MVAVNLLPWRQRRQRQQQRQSVAVFVLLLAGVLLFTTQQAWRNHQSRQRTAQEKARLTQRLQDLEAQLARQTQLRQQIAMLQKRQQKQHQQAIQLAAWQQFWLELPALLPDTAWLTRLEKRDGRLTLEGQAQDMTAIRHFRQQLASVALFSQLKQGGIKRQADGSYRFSLRAQVREIADE